MSTINKKPFIQTLLESLTDGQIEALSALINGGGNQTPLKRTMNVVPTGGKEHITASDKGIHLCELEFNYSLFKGYLVYNDDYCVLINFTDSQVLKMFDIDVAHLQLKTIDEELSVLELRSELDDTAGGASSTYNTFPGTWPTSGTTKAFCDAIAEDASAVVGMAYLGEVTFSDLPTGLVNSEVVVEIMDGTTANDKVIHLIMTSGNLAPYRWEYTYWNHGSNVSGWIGAASASTLAAPAYDATASYAIGDLVAHDNLLYMCNTAITGGEAWNSAHWTQTTLAEAVLGMINTGI